MTEIQNSRQVQVCNLNRTADYRNMNCAIRKNIKKP